MSTPAPLPLRRTLGFWLLLFYGVGVIVGAGIYVLVGTVAAKSGMLAPAAFLAAGVLAALTGLSYAELVTRLPEASGAVAYVHAAARNAWVAWIVAAAVLLVSVAAGASIARGSAGYVQRWIDVPDWLPGAVMVVAFTAIACLKVELGARLAAICGVLEVGGLLFATATGLDALVDVPARAAELVPTNLDAWQALMAGAFIAFFAFMGFETLANMAEETRDVSRILPRAIVASILTAAALYGLVALVAVMALPMKDLAGSTAPLCLLLDRAGMDCGRGFAAVALVALANGVIIEIMLLGRLLYGMARRNLAPAWFGAVSPQGRVPVRATLVGGGAMLLLVVAIPFEALASATSALTLAIFAAVNVALCVLKVRDRREGAAPPPVNLALWVPTLGGLASVALLAAALW